MRWDGIHAKAAESFLAMLGPVEQHMLSPVVVWRTDFDFE